MKIHTTSRYERMYEALVKQKSFLKNTVVQHVGWFNRNPSDSRLNNHPLAKRLTGKWSFSITNDVRILYEWLGKTTVRFIAIGTHRQIYRK